MPASLFVPSRLLVQTVLSHLYYERVRVFVVTKLFDGSLYLGAIGIVKVLIHRSVRVVVVSLYNPLERIQALVALINEPRVYGWLPTSPCRSSRIDHQRGLLEVGSS